MAGEAQAPNTDDRERGATFVRWCFYGADLLNLRAILLTQPELDDEDRERLSEALLERIHDRTLPHALSVYRAETASPDELGHCIATIALCLARSRKGEELATPPRFGVSMVISEERLRLASFPTPHTPSGCTSLVPGRPFHHDIHVADRDASLALVTLCAQLLLMPSTLTEVTPLNDNAGRGDEDIRRRRFNEQATRVLGHCKQAPYHLRKTSHAADAWPEASEGQSVVKVKEQLKRLRRLAELVSCALDDEA